jgi:pimeloyl-ACP methyl ester carboxylesterase
MSITATTTVHDVGGVPVTVVERGQDGKRPFLLLHGGAGPVSVASFADLLAQSGGGRVLAPVHPGFNGTPMADGVSEMADLARLYVQLIDDLDLSDVVVVGNSIGGWIAAEVALLGSPRVSAVLLIDPAGLAIATHPIVDFFSLTMDQVADLSYANPDKFRIDIDSFSPEQKAAMAGNRAALQRYGGASMADPTLLERLSYVAVPTLVVWGAADRVVPIEHGHAFADRIPGAELVIIHGAGHLPQLETPDELLPLVTAFAAAHQGATA